ncbi:hypothetical protein [Streptomyces sp. 2A115]|uniref:hypothetical protein n=1 Tax=Streptomyces sp. 2A115 TaxID=3457439 RepID=UPI003FCF04C7
MAEQAKLRERLRAVREIAPGYRGRLDEIVQAVERGTADYKWLPPLPAQPEQLPPLTTDAAQRL